VARGDASLQAGRNQRPLEEGEIKRVTSMFFNLDPSSNTRYDAASRTAFRPIADDNEVNHEIVFGPDIFPGPAVADPNACLSMKCAVAHELTHKSRHDDLLEINEAELEDIDEACTSLGAILRFQGHLSEQDVRELISDAIQRLMMYVAAYRAG
jgi:hypothetical protein